MVMAAKMGWAGRTQLRDEEPHGCLTCEKPAVKLRGGGFPTLFETLVLFPLESQVSAQPFSSLNPVLTESFAAHGLNELKLKDFCPRR